MKYEVEIKPATEEPPRSSGWAAGLAVAALILAGATIAGMILEIAIRH